MEKLISMTDFVFILRNRTTSELCKDFPKSFKIPVWNGDQSEMVKAMLAIDAIQWRLTGEYAKFLSQKLELWMFIPCKLVDGVWVVLECPKRWNDWQFGILENFSESLVLECKEYQEAKDRVLFEGFESFFTYLQYEMYVGNNEVGIFYIAKGHKEMFTCDGLETIEDLVKYNLVLTEKAKKMIGL